jgi:hypothetical protein
MNYKDKALVIAHEFSKQFIKKYGRGLFQIKTVTSSKWWSNFLDASNYIQEENIQEFIEYFFQREFLQKKIFPYMLVGKEGKEAYKDFCDYKETRKKTNEKEKIKYTIRYILDWSKRNNIQENRIRSFVSDSKNRFLIERNMFFTPIFYFSKTFLENAIVENIDIHRAAFRHYNNDVYLFLVKELKDDFIE